MLSFFYGHCKAITFLLIFSIFMTGCSSFNQMGKKEKSGTAVGVGTGAVIGGIIGNELGGDKGTVLGVLIGGLLGGVIGNKIGQSFDRRDQEIKKIARESNISVDTNTYSVLNGNQKSNFESQAQKLPNKQRAKVLQKQAVYTAVLPSQFEVGSSILSSETCFMFEKLAKAYKKDGVRQIMIVGHADYSGSSQVNQILSERRARTVAEVFVRNGYPANMVYYHGAGESQPVASNSTLEGRAKNRRVEIIDADKVSGLAMAKNISHQNSLKAVDVEKKRIIDENKKTQVKKVEERSIKYSKMCILQFKGEPYKEQLLLSNGRLVNKKDNGWSFGTLFGSEARAALIGSVPAFMSDNAIASGKVMRMDGKNVDIYSVSDYLPGYYKQPVYAFVIDDYFSLYPVSLLKSNLFPATQNPTVSIYNSYNMSKRNVKSDFVLKGDAWVYVNGDQILYRWKSMASDAQKTGVLGIDILMNKFNDSDFNKSHPVQFNSQVYYVKNNNVYTATIPVSVRLLKKNPIKWRL